MPVRMTEELRDAIESEPGFTVRILDERSNAAYVLIPEAIYERLCTLLDGEFEAANSYPHVTKLLAGYRLAAFADGD